LFGVCEIDSNAKSLLTLTNSKKPPVARWP
jgi:hypothetical protein